MRIGQRCLLGSFRGDGCGGSLAGLDGSEWNHADEEMDLGGKHD
jgi:hypothetical protein